MTPHLVVELRLLLSATLDRVASSTFIALSLTIVTGSATTALILE